jgi:hypothetical protein
MRRLILALATMACVFPATAGAVTFTSDATVTNKDYGTEQVVVVGPAHVTFDNVHWGAFNANGATYEGRLSVIRGGVAIVKNSKFGPGGCSDGIQASGGGGADGVVSVTNTEFVGIRQGSCGPHVDALQFYGGRATNFSDNYVHDVSTGIMGYDSNGQIDVFKNNVLVGDEYAAVLLASSNKNGVFTHNVVIGKSMQFDPGHGNVAPSGNIIKDNVASDIKVVGGTNNTVTNNLTSATFVGGTGRCAYATKSPTPQNTASDGGPIGLNDCAGPPPPPPPPSDRDGDGVPDASDACPDVAGTQADGCPPPNPSPGCDTTCENAYKAQIATLTQKLADMTTSRDNVQTLADAYKARALAAEGKLDQIHTLSAP